VTEEITDTPNTEIEGQAPIAEVDTERTAIAETPAPEPTQVPAYELVLAAIEDQPLTFEDDFSNEVLGWDIYNNDDNDSADNNLSQGGLINEKLVLSDENIKYSTEIVNGTDFVISAEINPKYDYDDGYVGGVTFSLFANEDRSEYLALDLNYEGYQLRQKLADATQEISSENFGQRSFPILDIYIISFDNTLTFILESDVMSSKTTDVVFSEEIPGISGEKIFISGSDGLGVDNFQFWNLEGIEITAAETPAPDPTEESTSVVGEPDKSEPFLPILDHINTAPPSFQEYFEDTPSDAWEFQSSDGPAIDQLGNWETDNRLRLPSINGNTSLYHPDMQNINDFALVINLSPGPNLSDFTYVFRQTGENANEDNYTGYGIKIYKTNKQWELFAYEPDYSYELKALSPFQPAEYYQIMIIAKGNSLGVFWEGDLIFTREDAQVRGDECLFTINPARLDAGVDMIAIDKIEFWNLEGVEIATAETPIPDQTEETANSTEEEATDSLPEENFENAILAYIDSHDPDIKDDFSEASSQWILADIFDLGTIDVSINPEDRNFYFENGELFLSNTAVNVRGSSFGDYVIDVDLRSEYGDHEKGIIFLNNSCAFYIRGPLYELICDREVLYKNAFNYTPNTIKIRLILKGSGLLIYINENPLPYFTVENPGFLYPFALYADHGAGNSRNIAAFSNFKLWNITNLELPWICFF